MILIGIYKPKKQEITMEVQEAPKTGLKPSEMKDSQLVELYIKLRDARAQRKAAFENDDAGDKFKQEKIESLLLVRFAESGHESIKTLSGTAYKSSKTSATIADKDAFFMGWVIPNQAWEFLDIKANKTSIVGYKTLNNELPPGINWREELTINVRRS